MNIIERVWKAVLNEKVNCTCNVPKVTVEPTSTQTELPKIEQLDNNIYNFAMKMQAFIKTKQVTSEDFTSRELEKISEDLANLNVEVEENMPQTADLDAKIAARLFILNNSLSNG